MRDSGLSLHRLLIRSALSGAHLFAWVFIFQFYYVQTRSVSASVFNLLLTYALAHIVVILAAPVAARTLRFGFHNGMRVAILSLSFAFLLLGAGFSGYTGSISLSVSLFALLVGLYKAFYRVPYEMMRLSSSFARSNGVEIFIALLPTVTGLYLTAGGLAPVYILYAASLVSIIALIPVASMKDIREGFAWTYRQTFHELFSIRHRNQFLHAFFSGIEATVLFIVWPIAVFTFLDWSYPLLGVVLSLTLIFTLIARRLFKDAIRTVPIRVRPLLAASGWIMRLGVGGFVTAVLVDTYVQTTAPTSERGMDMRSYEQSADNHTFIDEFTTLKEMALALGRVSACIGVAILFAVFTVPQAFAATFVVAAIAAAYAMRSVYREQSV